ncbi:Putative asparaginase [Gryllus bimaculatus]|nr:Putative asparaginase [Gryllus bimaculatus]
MFKLEASCTAVAPQPAFAAAFEPAAFEARLPEKAGAPAPRVCPMASAQLPPPSATNPCTSASNGSLAPPVSRICRRASAVDLTVDSAESRVLVIYTGGTIGMMRNEQNALVPVPNALVRTLRRNPVLHDEVYARTKFRHKEPSPPTLVLPDTQERNRVMYSILEYSPLLDSSNMTVEDWVQIGRDIRKYYEHYHGFVILHGTDTLAYTASALSFMLENLGKTVIITGSQIPLFEVRSDGRDNLLNAVIVAGNFVIPEVLVMFGDRIFRGNRTTKVSSECLNAFNSLNFPPLVTFGIQIEVSHKDIFRQTAIEKFCVHPTLDRNVGLLRLFPSITAETVKAFLQPPTLGVVLQSYGAGNVPSDRQDILDAIGAATQRGVIVVNTTQCMRGAVSDLYETGQALKAVGVTPGYDMTPEAALTKLSYMNLRGELTRALSGEGVTGASVGELVDAVAAHLQISAPREQEELSAILYPAIVNSAVMRRSVPKLSSLREYGLDLTAANADGRTPLHVACCEGSVDVVEFLLLRGANVHMKDSAAAKGQLKRFVSYQLAGADFNQVDSSHRTALHVAVLHNQETIVRFLIDVKVNLKCKDMLGETPLSIAIKLRHDKIRKILEEEIHHLS